MTTEKLVPFQLMKKGNRRVARSVSPTIDVPLINAVARAFYWQSLLDQGRYPSGSAIARAEGLHVSVVNEYLRLTLLAPAVVERVVYGYQAQLLSSVWFLRNSLPLTWCDQVSLFEGMGS